MSNKYWLPLQFHKMFLFQSHPSHTSHVLLLSQLSGLWIDKTSKWVFKIGAQKGLAQGSLQHKVTHNTVHLHQGATLLLLRHASFSDATGGNFTCSRVLQSTKRTLSQTCDERFVTPRCTKPGYDGTCIGKLVLWILGKATRVTQFWGGFRAQKRHGGLKGLFNVGCCFNQIWPCRCLGVPWGSLI